VSVKVTARGVRPAACALRSATKPQCCAGAGVRKVLRVTSPPTKRCKAMLFHVAGIMPAQQRALGRHAMPTACREHTSSHASRKGRLRVLSAYGEGVTCQAARGAVLQRATAHRPNARCGRWCGRRGAQVVGAAGEKAEVGLSRGVAVVALNDGRRQEGEAQLADGGRNQPRSMSLLFCRHRRR